MHARARPATPPQHTHTHSPSTLTGCSRRSCRRSRHQSPGPTPGSWGGLPLPTRWPARRSPPLQPKPSRPPTAAATRARWWCCCSCCCLDRTRCATLSRAARVQQRQQRGDVERAACGSEAGDQAALGPPCKCTLWGGRAAIEGCIHTQDSRGRATVGGERAARAPHKARVEPRPSRSFVAPPGPCSLRHLCSTSPGGSAAPAWPPALARGALATKRARTQAASTPTHRQRVVCTAARGRAAADAVRAGSGGRRRRRAAGSKGARPLSCHATRLVCVSSSSIHVPSHGLLWVRGGRGAREGRRGGGAPRNPRAACLAPSPRHTRTHTCPLRTQAQHLRGRGGAAALSQHHQGVWGVCGGVSNWRLRVGGAA